MMEIVVAFAIGLIVLCLVAKLIAIPFKLLWKFVTNSIAGAILLWVVTLFGVNVKINILTALVAGAFGIPGVLSVILFS